MPLMKMLPYFYGDGDGDDEDEHNDDKTDENEECWCISDWQRFMQEKGKDIALSRRLPSKM